MEKAGIRTRDIQFWSEKNQQMVCVHSRRARNFARWLEEQPWVKMYQTCVPLELDKLPHVNPVDIRKEYLNTEWTTDFLIHTADGRTAVREFIDAGDFTKKANMEKLELSRRYWTALDISDWKLIISGESIAKQTGGAS